MKFRREFIKTWEKNKIQCIDLKTRTHGHRWEDTHRTLLPLIPTYYDSVKIPFNSTSSDHFHEECSVIHMILCIRRLVSKHMKIFAQHQRQEYTSFWPAFLINIKQFFSWIMVIHLHRVKLISAKNYYLKSTRKWQVSKQFWKLLNTTQLI